MSNDDMEAANRHIENWARDKKDFNRVRQRMGEIVSTDLNLVRNGRAGLGTIRDGTIDLDHAYDLARRTHPETLAEIRREKNAKPQRQVREPEKARDTILRSLRQLKERE